MIARDQVGSEVFRLEAIEARRGELYEDERAALEAYRNCARWMDEDKKEAERIEAEALAAQQEEEEAARRNDPNAKTKELFGSYRNKLQKEGRMR